MAQDNDTGVVIVGAGFGGLQCARALARRGVRVTVVDRDNYHLFTPLLYQVASSLLNPSDIAYPVRAVFRGQRNVTFRLDDVTDVDVGRQVVRTGSGLEIPYRHLVLACGTNANFFGRSDIEERAHGLKDLADALELRNHVLTCFEHAVTAASPDERQRWLTFVVVGGGPTGVEYAGALVELVRLEMVRDYVGLARGDVRIVLVEGRDRALPAFPESLGRDAERRLRQRGIDVRLGLLVDGVSDHAVQLSDGSIVEAHTLVWAAGVKPNDLDGTLELPRRKSGRIEVDPMLRVAGYDNVWALGDVAGVLQDGEELPMLAPPAMQEGRYVARSIMRLDRGQELTPFRYHDKGILATIGRNAAVAKVGPLALTGFIGWVTWLVVHLYYIIGFRNRFAVLLRWAWNYVFYDRPIRFIWRIARMKE